MELREQILEGTVAAFNNKGLKFTMDDIASSLGISKKTIYTVFKDKEELFLEMVNYLFDGIKASEIEVVNNDSLSTYEKIRKIFGVMPESYKNIDFQKLYMLKDKYPHIYRQVETRLETGWDTTLALLQKGIDEGVVRPVNLQLFKMMFEASLEQFFSRDILVANSLTYAQALEQVVDILTEGIKKTEVIDDA